MYLLYYYFIITFPISSSWFSRCPDKEWVSSFSILFKPASVVMTHEFIRLSIHYSFFVCSASTGRKKRSLIPSPVLRVQWRYLHGVALALSALGGLETPPARAVTALPISHGFGCSCLLQRGFPLTPGKGKGTVGWAEGTIYDQLQYDTEGSFWTVARASAEVVLVRYILMTPKPTWKGPNKLHG